MDVGNDLEVLAIARALAARFGDRVADRFVRCLSASLFGELPTTVYHRIPLPSRFVEPRRYT
jgi:hypothetical protein